MSPVRLQPDTSPPGLGFWRPLVDTLILAASTVADTEEKPGFSLPAYLGRTPKPMGIMGSGALSRINISDQNPGGAGKVKQRAECVGQPCPWRCTQACFQRHKPLGPRLAARPRARPAPRAPGPARRAPPPPAGLRLLTPVSSCFFFFYRFLLSAWLRISPFSASFLLCVPFPLLILTG